MNAPSSDFVATDPFDLPEWLGTAEVTWQADADIDHRGQVTGRLRATAADGAAAPLDSMPLDPIPLDSAPQKLACDLVAADVAVPEPAVSDGVRRAAHLAWRDGQVLVGQRDGRLALAVPGVEFDSVLVVETLRRLCKAVGAPSDRWLVAIRIGSGR